MKRVALLFISFLLLLSFGCATREYVKQEIEKCCKKSEAAAKKCEKSFELQQQK
jgi:hypothetical protein